MKLIKPDIIINFFKSKNVDFFSGVPDSVLSGLSSSIDDLIEEKSHIIAANEGNALALAMGHFLSTSKAGVVYLQNSGLGNIVNPLTSLLDRDVYHVPVFLLIGWRGEPGKKDEPQHVKQGRITPQLLDILGVPYWVVEENYNTEKVLSYAWETMLETGSPVAILIKKGSIETSKPLSIPLKINNMTREKAISMIIDRATSRDIFVATTGMAGRELFELRAKKNQVQDDFLTVGGMGHASSIALGISISKPEKRIICLDGDGALIMHMGALPIIGDLKPKNFIHVLLNNAAHDSVGGQPTVGDKIDIKSLVISCGYKAYYRASNIKQFSEVWEEIQVSVGPVMLELMISKGARKDLGRPTSTPNKNKLNFMHKLLNT